MRFAPIVLVLPPVLALLCRHAAGQEIPAAPQRIEAPDYDSFFLLDVPADGEGEMPLIIALHGMGDNPGSFREVFNDLPGRHGYVLALPGGNHEVPCQCGRCDGMVRTWGPKSADFVSWVTEEVKKRCKVDPTRVCVFGFSAGAHMTFALGLSHPADYAAIVPFAGMIPPGIPAADLARARSLPVMGFVGGMDPFCGAMRQGFRTLEAAGFRRAALKTIPGLGHEAPAAEIGGILDRLDALAGTFRAKAPGLSADLEKARKDLNERRFPAAIAVLLGIADSGVHGPFTVEALRLLDGMEAEGRKRIEEAVVKAGAGDRKGASGILEGVRRDFAGLRCAAEAFDRPAKKGDHECMLHAGRHDRRFLVHVPPSYDGIRPVPAVVMLHGGGGSGKGAAEETGWSKKADSGGFLAVYPDAMPADPSKPARFSSNPQVWNDGSGRFEAGGRAVDDVEFLSLMLDDVTARFAVDAGRIYLSGFSNGASMAFLAASRLSARVAAVAPVAGACWTENPEMERGIPLLYVTGDDDPMNPLDGGMPRTAEAGIPLGGREKPPVRESLRRWISALGCSEKPVGESDDGKVKTSDHGTGRDGAGVVFILIKGHGHAWSGGKNLLPESVTGRCLAAPDTTSLIWEFFRSRKR